MASAFSLGLVRGELVPGAPSDCPTWRLTTSEGAYLVKSLRSGTDSRALWLEERALAAGLSVPAPVGGGVRELAGHGMVRVYPWLEHRPYVYSPLVAGWLGRTLSVLHSLAPASPPDVPWADRGVWPESVWTRWASAGKPWAAVLGERLPVVVGLSARLVEVYSRVPDWVVTHGDFEPHNVLITAEGPVLVDWDTVWVYSAALQAGRVAYAFGAGEPFRVRAILAAYEGDVSWAGMDLFVSTLSHELASLGLRIAAVLGEIPAPRWLRLATADERIARQLDGLPALISRLNTLAAHCAAAP